MWLNSPRNQSAYKQEFSLKQNINLGAYGWQHTHWQDTFYPADLPADWQLSYYSNEFNCVLVPAVYWQGGDFAQCESWLESVHEDFQFFLECHMDIFDHLEFAVFAESLEIIRPQLSGLVFLDEKQQIPTEMERQFVSLFESLAIDVYSSCAVFAEQDTVRVGNVWRPEQPQISRFAYIEHDLSNLRELRPYVESFAGQLDKVKPQVENATMIVHHAHLQAADLSKLRAVVEIMGY